MKRLLTALVAIPLAFAAVFLLPPLAFFLVIVFLLDWAALEFIHLVRPLAPRAPLGALLVLVPLAAWGMAWALGPGNGTGAGTPLLAAAALLAVGCGSLVLFARTPVAEAVPALAVLCFGTPYFALPAASLYELQRHDPWVLFLLCAVVWLGDSAALYVGTAIGRHRLAATVSPKKSWEGAIAGFAVSLAATAAWSAWRLGRVDGTLLAVGAATAVAAQVGDLVESMLKRGAGVKDSGGVLPGHGGIFDRMDAMLFAAPTMLLGLLLTGLEIARR
jgi:phosphatidate cytidylyltransferase